MALERNAAGQIMNPHRTHVSEKQAEWRAKRDVIKEEKEAKRLANAEARAKRTPQQQLDRLDELLGKGVGAKKERARLESQL